MKLFWGSGSSPCMKVIMALVEKGKWGECESRLINFSKKEHQTDEMLKLNPRGQVPTFVDGDVTVCESVAACLYLEDRYKDDGNQLIPTNLAERAVVYQRMFEVANLTSNVIVPYVYYLYRTKPEDIDQEVVKKNASKVGPELQVWEKYLGEKKYLAGDNFTMADVFFYPELCTLIRQGLDIAKFYPNMKKYYDSLQGRESVVASFPPHWKDEPSRNVMKDFDPTVEQSQK